MQGTPPIVSIVGRPNVGKSTLFNRIIGKRDAIVDPTEGVTRDRKYGEATWSGHNFILIDTGGYDARSEDVILASVKEQAEIALDESDLILFMVDASTGITVGDDDLARLMHKKSKKVLLVANKADNEKSELSVFEFLKLGLGEPLAISAESGRRTGDLLDAVISHFPSNLAETEKSEDEISIAVVGVPNSGKSSFVNKLLEEERQIVTDIPGTTRDSADSLLIYNDQSFSLIDTAGLRKKAKVKENIEFYSTVRARRAMARSDVVTVIIDAARGGLQNQDVNVIIEALEKNKCLVCAVNKWDLIEKDTHTQKHWLADIHEILPLLEYYPVLFISALTGQRVFKVLDVATEIYTESQKRIKTRDLNDWLKKLVQITSLPSYRGKFVKLSFVNQTQSVPPTFVFFTNEPEGIKDNYKRFLEASLRAAFGFFGVPISLTFKLK